MNSQKAIKEAKSVPYVTLDSLTFGNFMKLEYISIQFQLDQPSIIIFSCDCIKEDLQLIVWSTLNMLDLSDISTLLVHTDKYVSLHPQNQILWPVFISYQGPIILKWVYGLANIVQLTVNILDLSDILTILMHAFIRHIHFSISPKPSLMTSILFILGSHHSESTVNYQHSIDCFQWALKAQFFSQ